MPPRMFEILPNPHRSPGDKATFVKLSQYETERRFANFCHKYAINAEYEPHTIYLPELDCFFTPDWLIPGWGYVEISDVRGRNAHQRSKKLWPKRRKIRLVAQHCGIPVLILHPAYWPRDLAEFRYLQRRAELAATFELYDPRRTDV